MLAIVRHLRARGASLCPRHQTRSRNDRIHRDGSGHRRRRPEDRPILPNPARGHRDSRQALRSHGVEPDVVRRVLVATVHLQAPVRLREADRPRTIHLRAPVQDHPGHPRGRPIERRPVRLGQGVVPDVPDRFPRRSRAKPDEGTRQVHRRLEGRRRRVGGRRGLVPAPHGPALARVHLAGQADRLQVPRVGIRQRRQSNRHPHEHRRQGRGDRVRIPTVLRGVLPSQGRGWGALGVAHGGRGRVARSIRNASSHRGG